MAANRQTITLSKPAERSVKSSQRTLRNYLAGFGNQHHSEAPRRWEAAKCWFRRKFYFPAHEQASRSVQLPIVVKARMLEPKDFWTLMLFGS
jgi:hypothetical protein